MPGHQHAQRPSDDEPPPCDCGGCREFRAIHAGHRAELPEPERIAKRAADRVAQRRYEDAEAALAATRQRGAA